MPPACVLHMGVAEGVRNQAATRVQRAELCTVKLTVVADGANILVAQRVLKAEQISV